MKKWIWLVLCVAVLLTGCTSGAAQGQQQEKEDWQMNETMMQMIKDAVGCNDRRAKAILETFLEVQMPEPVSADPLEEGSNSIVVETADGGKYEVGIDKKYYVYSIRNLTTGESLYMVIE